MTINRFIATACFYCLLSTVLSGQHQDQPTDSSSFFAEQPFVIETLASTDSAGTELNVPNVFTPNGDNINDYFEVTTDGTTIYEFTIFTRYGTRVYYSLSPRIFWDGQSSGGLDLSEGIYYYVIEETGDSEPFEKAGFIHLFR